MLLKTKYVANTLAPFTYLKKFSYSFSKATQSPVSPALINPNLLYRVSQEQTLRALEFTMEQNNFLYKLDHEDMIVFDQISETLDSKTHRVFDLYQKKFFAVKTLNLESEMAWRHLNIMLRRYHDGSSPIATIRSFDYNKATNKVHIVSDIGKTILSDYAAFRKKNEIPWTKVELRSLVWQLINQMHTFKKIGVACTYLKPEHMFVSNNGDSIQLFDYPGFDIESKLVRHLRPHLDMNIVLITLVRIIDPCAPVSSIAEAKSYLKIYYPDFLKEFESGGFRNVPLENMFWDKRYEQTVTEKFKKMLESKNLPRFEENWGLINQGLFQTKEAINIFESLRDRHSKHGQTEEGLARVFLHLGEIYQNAHPEISLEFFSKAASISSCLPHMDNAVKARIFNEYGKTLWDKDNTKGALECFREVQKILRNSAVVPSPSRLRKEIKANLKYLENNCDSDGTSCEVTRFPTSVKLYFMFMGFVVIDFVSWMIQNGQVEPQKEPKKESAEKAKTKDSKKVVAKPDNKNSDIKPQMSEQDKQEKRQKRINWTLFGLSLVVSTAMIAI